jgi:hypothetical protein
MWAGLSQQVELDNVRVSYNHLCQNDEMSKRQSLFGYA